MSGKTISLSFEIIRRRATFRFRLERPRRGRVKRNSTEILPKARGRRFCFRRRATALRIGAPRLMPDQVTRGPSIINSLAEA